MKRECPICHDEIPATAHRLKKLCGKPECMLEQQRISSRKSYHKVLGHTEPEKRSCVVCHNDISHLRGNRVVCEKAECKETIVKRSKNDYYERNHGTSTDAERRRQASATYRAKHRPVQSHQVVRVKPTAAPKLDSRYQRVPRASQKPTIVRRQPVKHVDLDKPWVPMKPFNLPESMPQYGGLKTKIDSDFADPWNCQACRENSTLCRLHQRMTDDGSNPPLGRAINLMSTI